MDKKILLKVLDKKRQAIFPELAALFQNKEHYLAGGTALALQIGHRESFDFDIFGNKEITFHFKNKILWQKPFNYDITLGRRGNYRDYFDLYVVIKNGYATIKEIIKWCQKKYGAIFSERMFLGTACIFRGFRGR